MVCPRLGCVQRWTVMTGALPLAALQLQSRAGAAVMRNKREQNCICQGGKMEQEVSKILKKRLVLWFFILVCSNQYKYIRMT